MESGAQQFLLGYYPLNGDTPTPMWAPPRGSIFPDSYVELDPNFQAGAAGGGPASPGYVKLTANPSGASTTYVIDKARLVLSGDVGGVAAGTRALGLEIANAGGSLGIVALGVAYLPVAGNPVNGVLFDSGMVDFGPFGAGPDNILDATGPGIRLGPDSYIYLTNSAAEQLTGTVYVLLMYHLE